MVKDGNKRLMITLSDEDIKNLEHLIQEQGKTKSEVIRKLIRDIIGGVEDDDRK